MTRAISTCVGCGRPYMVKVEVPGRPESEELPFCRGRRRVEPKPECVRAYLEKGIPCVGCGEKLDYNNAIRYPSRADARMRPICRHCDVLLTDARKKVTEEDQAWYGIHSFEAFRGIGNYGTLCRLFGKVLGDTGKCFIDHEPLLEHKADNTGDVWVLLPSWQAQAAKAFLEALQAAVDGEKAEAKQEGHSMLVRLARGEISVDDYNSEARDLRGEQDE